MFPPKPFPIPIATLLGAGGQSQSDLARGPIDFMPMLCERAVCHAPAWPEPALLASREDALAALRGTIAALNGHLDGAAAEPVELAALGADDRTLIDRLLGEGEVAAQLAGPADGVQAQESVFAGVWRVRYREGEAVVRDTIEVGAFPRAIAEAARREGLPMPPLPAPPPADTMNAPAVLQALREHSRAWLRGRPRTAGAHVVNLSLLPLTAGDSHYVEQQLGRGRVRVLSRGYANCRVVNTRAAGVWRVTYFDSQDTIVLDTLEVGPVPEVACAARQDLEDSAERLAEVLRWVEAS